MSPGWTMLACLSVCYFCHYCSLVQPVGPTSGGRMLCHVILLLVVAVIGSSFQGIAIAGDGKSCILDAEPQIEPVMCPLCRRNFTDSLI